MNEKFSKYGKSHKKNIFFPQEHQPSTFFLANVENQQQLIEMVK